MQEKSFYIVEIVDGKEKNLMEKFHKLIAAIEQNQWSVYGLEIRKNGELLHAYGDTKDTRYPIYSATKSFVSTTAGIAVKEGKFSVKDARDCESVTVKTNGVRIGNPDTVLR